MQEIFGKITIIIPCWNEANCIRQILFEIDNTISKNFKMSEYEIVIVDDGSTDDLITSIKETSKEVWRTRFRLKLIQLRTNYGKDSAILAGFEHSSIKSELFLIIDADGQHPPSMIPIMYETINSQEELDQVVGFRKGKQEHTLVHLAGSALYSLLAKRKKTGSVESDYRIIRRKIFQDVSNMSDSKIHLQSIIRDTGAATQSIEYTIGKAYYHKKHHRKSRWSLLRLFDYALVALLSGKESILKFFVVVFTINLTSAGFLIGMTVVRTLQTKVRSGTSTILIVNSLYFAMLASLLFLVLIYLRLILSESKQRPLYLIKRIEEII